jgi:hypothetical protein
MKSDDARMPLALTSRPYVKCIDKSTKLLGLLRTQ